MGRRQKPDESCGSCFFPLGLPNEIDLIVIQEKIIEAGRCPTA